METVSWQQRGQNLRRYSRTRGGCRASGLIANFHLNAGDDAPDGRGRHRTRVPRSGTDAVSSSCTAEAIWRPRNRRSLLLAPVAKRETASDSGLGFRQRRSDSELADFIPRASGGAALLSITWLAGRDKCCALLEGF
jgi:hypothetical protein